MSEPEHVGAVTPAQADGSRVMRNCSITLGVVSVALLAAGLAFVGQARYERQVQMGTLAVLWISAAAVWSGATRPMRRGMLGAGVLGWVSEAIGVHTGYPFGLYRYEAVMGPSVLEVPVAMVPAWAVLTAFAVSVVPIVHPLVRSPGVAACLVLVDLVLDPVAVSVLGLWTWTTGGGYYGVPTSNYAGWFVVGWLCALCYPASVRSAVAAWLGWGLVLFYTVIAASNGLVVPAAMGVGTVMVTAALWYWRRGK